MRVCCRTNLDLRGEKWPDDMPAVPNVGDYIRSETVHKGGFQLELEVKQVTWEKIKNDFAGIDGWVPEIEMGMTKWQRMLPASRPGACDGSTVAFYEWYAPKVGTSASAFI